MTDERHAAGAHGEPRLPLEKAWPGSAARSDTLLVNRYECKYVIQSPAVKAIRELMAPFVRPDRFAPAGALPVYPVHSLYLDTPDLELCRRTLCGERDRYKLRVRSYSDDPSAPVFLEVKRRVDAMVIKSRCQVSRAMGETLVRGGGPTPGMRSTDGAVLREFLTLMARGARPVLCVRYRREAYEARGAEPVRITFDSELEHAVSDPRDPSDAGTGWHPTPAGGIVLEIKFTERFPSWVASMIHVLALQRLSLPKYCLSMVAAVREGRYRDPRAGDLQAALAGMI